MRNKVNIRLAVRKDGVAGIRYKIISINGALTVDGDDEKPASPGDWIGSLAAESLIFRDWEYNVTVTELND
jgi:hypothetical protein